MNPFLERYPQASQDALEKLNDLLTQFTQTEPTARSLETVEILLLIAIIIFILVAIAAANNLRSSGATTSPDDPEQEHYHL